MTRPLLCGFLKVRNERLRGPNNLDRVLTNLKQYCDTIVVCDDASVDGTREVLQDQIPEANLILVPPMQQDFRHELRWKQQMLDRVRAIDPEWVFWLDGDEVLDANGTANLQDFCASRAAFQPGWRFPEVNLWNPGWARTDSLFDEGAFIRLWQWHEGLSFAIVDDTHHHQFPQQLLHAPIGTAPFSVLHYGNVGVNLRWKAIQYWGGLGGVDRHIAYTNAMFRPVDREIFPEHCAPKLWPWPVPAALPADEIAGIRRLENLRNRQGWFTVVCPAYNRAHTLDRTVQSVLSQTYPNWVLLLIDDGSTDDTWPLMQHWQAKDPRIFALQGRGHRGGVAVNELGMDVACEWTQYWTRIGSDDTFSPFKLEKDLSKLGNGAEAVFGPFQVVRGGNLAEVCRLDECRTADGHVEASEALKRGIFTASWANVAVTTDVLRRVKARWGNYVDPRIQNMEDFLFNARVAILGVNWVWREGIDGFWTAAEQNSASAADHQGTISADEGLTRQLIAQGGGT